MSDGEEWQWSFVIRRGSSFGMGRILVEVG